MAAALLACVATASGEAGRPASGFPGVGVLLPLSGQYESFGSSCLRGIRLALGAVGNRVPAVRVVIRDTGGDANAAARAYRSLASDPGLTAVLGPMLSWEVGAIQGPTTEAGLPALSFSQRSPTPGAPIFRFSMSKEDQAGVVAWYAVRDRNLLRWAILHPTDSYGVGLASAFHQQIEALGGEVVASVSYEKGKTDFQEEIGRLQRQVGEWTGPEDDEDRELLLHIDGVYIPDSAERILLLAPHLAYFDIRDVQLLGSSGWNDADTLARAGGYVEGAVFVDGFFAHSPQPAVQKFVDDYRDAYGSNPGILEAYGYDAARAVLGEMRRGVETREQMDAALRRPLLREGATGWTEQNGTTDFRKHLFLLEVRDGMIQEIGRIRPNLPLASSPGLEPGSHSPLGLGFRRVPTPGGTSPSPVYRQPEFDSRTDSLTPGER